MPDPSYLFLGDSITDAGHLWEQDPRMLGQGFVRKISEHRDFSQARLTNRGQDGFTSADLLRLVRRLSGLENYDCVTILIGVNDLSVARYADPAWIPERFDENLQALMTLIRRSFKKRLLLMEPFLFVPPAENLHMLPFLGKERHILQKAAQTFSGEYVSLQQTLDAAVQQQGLWEITTDGIHLTDLGNQLLADRWIETYIRRV